MVQNMKNRHGIIQKEIGQIDLGLFLIANAIAQGLIDTDKVCVDMDTDLRSGFETANRHRKVYPHDHGRGPKIDQEMRKYLPQWFDEWYHKNGWLWTFLTIELDDFWMIAEKMGKTKELILFINVPHYIKHNPDRLNDYLYTQNHPNAIELMQYMDTHV